MNLDNFVGMSPEEAADLAEEMGYIPRLIPVGGFYTQDIRNDRITIWLGEDGKVKEARAL